MAAKPVVVRITGDASGLARSLESIDGRMARTSALAAKFGGVLAGAFAGQQVIRGAGAAIAAAGRMDQALASVRSVTGASTKEMNALEASARKMGIAYGFGGSAVTKAAGDLVRADVSTKDVLGGALKNVQVLARAGEMELAPAVDTVAQALNIFQLKGKDTGLVVDLLANAANKTTADVSQLSMGLGTGSAAVKALGGDVQDAVLDLALLEKAGKHGQDAGTSLKAGFTRMVTPEGKKALKGLNLDLLTNSGAMKSAAGVSAELRKELGGLHKDQRLAALASFAGTDGMIAFDAIMQQTPASIRKMREELGKEGTASKVAQEASKGYEQSLGRLKAVREDMLRTIGKPTVNALADVADELGAGLQDPKTQVQLERLGVLLKDGVAGGVHAVVAGLQDGSIQHHLGQIVDVAESGAEVLGHFADAGGQILGVVSKIPGPVLQAAAAFGIWRAAAAALTGPLSAVATGGAKSGAMATTSAGRARQAAAAEAASGGFAAGPRGARNSYQLQRALGDTRGGSAASALGLRNTQGVVTARSTFGATGMTGRGIGAAVAAGAVGTAMGGSFMSKVTAGAAVGSLGGPWGMAGGAVAAAAGAGLQSILKGKAADSAAAMGRAAGLAVQTTIGKGLSAEAQKVLTDLKLAADRASKKRDQEEGVQDRTGPQRQNEATKAQQRLGRSMGNEGVAALKARGTKVGSVQSVISDLVARSKGEEPEAKKAAALPYLAYVRELERQGTLTKGATDRFKKRIEKGMNFKIDGSVQTQLKVDLRHDVGTDVIKQIRAKIKKDAKDFGIALDTKVDLKVENLGKTLSKQKKELDARAKAGSGYSKDERDAAKKASDAVQKLIDKYELGAKKSAARSKSEVDKTRELTGALKDQNVELQKRNDLAAAFDVNPSDDVGVVPTIAPTPRRAAPKRRRAGGRVQRFQGGGLVDVLASPGEMAVLPDGSAFTIPGPRVAADNVALAVEPGTAFLTDHMQQLMADGASMDTALNIGRPHFRKGGAVPGGKVTGKTSWFGGPNDVSTRGRKTALGLSTSVPGVAIRPGATFQTGRPYLGGYWDVHVGGKNSVLRQTDLGPHERTGKRIDITSSALGQLGYTEKSFPTGATGWAAYLGKDRQAALRRAASGKKSGELASPIMVGASKRARAPLVSDAFSQGFSRGLSGLSMSDVGRFPGLGIGKALGEAVSSLQTTSKIAMSSSSLGGGKSGNARLDRMIAKANEIDGKKYQYAWGGGHGRLGVPSRGSRHAHGVGPVGLGFDCSGGVSAVLGAGGLLDGPRTSGALMSFGKKGPGKKLNVYADQSHVIMDLAGRPWGTGSGNPKGGAGWLPRNTMRGRGAVRTAQGFRRGGVTGDAATRRAAALPESLRSKIVLPRSGDFLEEGFRLGGRVRQAFKTGGTVQATAVLGMVRGRAEDYAGPIDAAIAGLTQSRIEKLRAELQKASNSAGSKAGIAKAQAALTVVDDALGMRAGASAFRAQNLSGARAVNMNSLQQLQRLRGYADTPQALQEQKQSEQRFLAGAPKARADLQKQQTAALKRGALDEAKQLGAALDQLEDDAVSAAVSIKDLEASTVELVAAQREAATANAASAAEFTTSTSDDAAAKRQAAADARQRGVEAYNRGDLTAQAGFYIQAQSLDRDAQRLDRRNGIAEAETARKLANLTETTDDDKAGDLNLQALYQQGFNDAQAAGDTTDMGEFADLLVGIKASIDQGNAESKASSDAQLELTKQALEDAKREIANRDSIDLASVIGAVANGYIGTNINAAAGLPSPRRY